MTIDEQKVLGQKLGELTGKPESSKLHVHPITEETSELGDEVSVITSDRRGEYEKYDKSQLSAYVFRALTTTCDNSDLQIHVVLRGTLTLLSSPSRLTMPS